ncbi:sodium:calcium antiporter [Candidatus Altiarchaeota archaeon]
MIELLVIFAGLVGLAIGADYAVEAARKMAARLGVSEILVGLTITSIGTSLPEISTNIMSGLSTLGGEDASGIAVGNIIGSDLSQITLLLGITGAIATLTMPKKSLKRDGLMLFIAILVMYATAIDGYVSRGEGMILVATYLVYLTFIITQEKITLKQGGKRDKARHGIAIELAKILVGLLLVVYCANVIVDTGVALATRWGVSAAIIGLFVGLGTSVPELSVAVRAIQKKAGQLSLGNLIGSNITDPLLSFGLGASIAGVHVSDVVLRFDFPFWAASTAIALLLLYNHLDLNRKEASVLIIVFALFMYIRLTFFAA